MAANIVLQPEKAWEYFQENKARFSEEMVEIASNEQTNTSVYLTEEQDLPYVVVERDEEEMQREGCVSNEDLTEALQKIFIIWLQDAESEFDAENPVDLEVFQEMIDDRESDLEEGFAIFLDLITTDPYGINPPSGIRDGEAEMLNDVLQLLANKHNLSIYRPMVLFDEEEKRDVCTEYPYNEYVFDEEEIPESNEK